jgi:hypothetical protein
MRFRVQCVRCGRVTGIRFIESVSADSPEEESVEQDRRLGGYTIECPACRQQRHPQNPLPHVTAAVAANLTEAIPLGA